MKKLLVINWEMRGDRETIRRWLETFKGPSGWEPVALLPTPYLDEAADFLRNNPRPLALGAQTVSPYTSPGAYTGETAAYMLADIEIHYVLIRSLDRELYTRKLNAARAAGLHPLIEREAAPSSFTHLRGAADGTIVSATASAPNRLLSLPAYEKLCAQIN